MENENNAVHLEKISNLLLDKKKENLKYNKQEMPDILKDNSDDEDSFNSKENNEINNNNLTNININQKEENLDDNIINKEEESKNKEEKNSYELLILKKMDIVNKENNNNHIEEIKNIETEKKEKQEEIKETVLNTIENKRNEKEIDKYSSKTFSKKAQNKDTNDKKNVLKLLSLIKNKINEKEKLDKEKESIKEEIFKRAKSQEGDKIKKNDDDNININIENKSPKNAYNQIKQIIYNKKRKSLNNNKSVNIKSYNNNYHSIERDDSSDKNLKKNNINNIYKHHIPNKSMDINNNNKKVKNQNEKSLGKIKENKKIINNYYFSNGNYNFNNFFPNNLSPKNANKIYRKKNLNLKENNIELSHDNNSSSKYDKIINENSTEKNYKTNIENYDSSINYSSMNSNRFSSKNKINLKVNKKSFYINTDNFDIENISFKNNSNFKEKTKHIINTKYLIGKNYSKKNNYNIEIYNNKKKIRNKIWNFFKIEDLLIIDEKIISLLDYIKYNKEIYKQCFDIFNFYFNSSLYKKLENIFLDEKYINIIKSSIKFFLISLIIIYEYSFHKNIFNQTKNALYEIIQINYNNICLIKYQIINYILKNKFDKSDNIWIQHLLKEIKNININLNLDNTLLLISYINNNNISLNSKLSIILNNFTLTENNAILIDFLLQIKIKSFDDINSFMKNNIIKIENFEGSLIAAVYLRNNSIFCPVNPPYIKTPLLSKQYTLVLDLDETLVNFKIKSGREGYVRLRPFLFGFLEEVSQYYELIIFTSATEAYANSVIEAIEQEKKYFEFIFYRQHTIIIGNEFVKDLTRIGRPLNSTIIIDNMPQNFRFQKENGICIKPFWGQDSNDKTLYNLIPILIDIAKMGGDLRLNLNKYKDEIISKITSNLN